MLGGLHFLVQSVHNNHIGAKEPVHIGIYWKNGFEIDYSSWSKSVLEDWGKSVTSQ